MNTLSSAGTWHKLDQVTCRICTLVLLEFDAEEASSSSIVTSESSTELLMSLRVAQEQ